jgi:ribosomal-protein-alanine N-acetyltransferase
LLLAPVAMFDFAAFPEIGTERLHLRCLRVEDTAAIYAVRSDYEVTKYNSGAAYTQEAQALQLITRSIEGILQKRSIYWALSLKESGAVVGQLGYNCWDQDNHSGEVGFDLRRDMWGKGIMKEALQAIILFGFRHVALNRIGANTSAYNDQCVALLTKIGFQHEGTQREQYFEDDKYHDLKLYALLKRECPEELNQSMFDVQFVGLPALPV